MRYDTSFYGSKSWRNARRAVLLSNPQCSVNGCTEPSQHVDHQQARRDGSGQDYDPANLIALCASHHSQKTVAQDGGFGRQADPNYVPIVKGCDVNGTPKSTDHHWNK